MPANSLPDHESHRCRPFPVGPSVRSMRPDPRGRGPDTSVTASGQEANMNTNRRIAVVAGVAVPHCDGCTGGRRRAGVPDPECSGLSREHLGERDRVAAGALLLFIGALACTGIALALYPVLKEHNHGLAIGSVGFRTIEGVLHSLIAICWLLLVTVSQEAVSAGAPASSAYRVHGAAAHRSTRLAGPLALLAFGLGALCTTGPSSVTTHPSMAVGLGACGDRMSWLSAVFADAVSPSAPRRRSSSWRLRSACRRWCWRFG